MVIPFNFRKNIKEEDTLIVIKSKDRIILKPSNAIDKQFAEDLEFAKRTEKAWKEIESGKGIKMSNEEFLKEMDNW